LLKASIAEYWSDGVLENPKSQTQNRFNSKLNTCTRGSFFVLCHRAEKNGQIAGQTAEGKIRLLATCDLLRFWAIENKTLGRRPLFGTVAGPGHKKEPRQCLSAGGVAAISGRAGKETKAGRWPQSNQLSARHLAPETLYPMKHVVSL
jgi:hypothetical protein